MCDVSERIFVNDTEKHRCFFTFQLPRYGRTDKHTLVQTMRRTNRKQGRENKHAKKGTKNFTLGKIVNADLCTKTK